MAREFLAQQGITDPPVDAEALVRSLASVRLFDHPTFDGFSFFDRRRSQHVVYVNALIMSDGRKQWTWAHELGHIVLGHLRYLNCSNLPEHVRQILDREADAFAAELLMPAEWVHKFVPIPCDAKELRFYKSFFGVSWEALINRLDELRLQPREESETYLRKFFGQNPEWEAGLWKRSRSRRV